jgi:DNA-binding LacI/PurR family transcriptional regulator
MAKLPFKIRREDGASLTDQFASGLRYAIHSGSLRSGDTLPTLTEMAAQTGVSAIVVRHAVKSLANEGLLHVRHGCGITVNGLGGQGWRASVLGLNWSAPTMYYQSVRSGVVAKRLHAGNVLFNAAHISYEDANENFPKIKADLAHPVSLVVLQGMSKDVDELLVGKGIPFIHFTSSRPSPRAVRTILLRHALVLPAVSDHCLACGVREVMSVGLPNDARNKEFAKLFNDTGMHCRTLTVKQIVGVENPECVERGAFNDMETWLKGERRLPDLIWFSDDFVARGALMAMTSRGVRVPEDVQVITWANRGFVPAFTKPLTRVEMDPVRDGEVIAACVLEQLDGKHPDKKQIELAPVFIEGATTIKKTRRHV